MELKIRLIINYFRVLRFAVKYSILPTTLLFTYSLVSVLNGFESMNVFVFTFAVLLFESLICKGNVAVVHSHDINSIVRYI